MFSMNWSLIRRMPFGRIAGGMLFAALAGCVSDDAPKLSLESQQTLKLTAATVDFAPDARIHISAVEDEVVARGGSKEQVAESERAQIGRVLPEEFIATVGPKLAGSRPVTARVHVKYFNIPGPVQTVVVNGGLELSAGVDLVDAKTGEILNSIPPGKISSAVYRPSGIIGLAFQAAEFLRPLREEDAGNVARLRRRIPQLADAEIGFSLRPGFRQKNRHHLNMGSGLRQ